MTSLDPRPDHDPDDASGPRTPADAPRRPAVLRLSRSEDLLAMVPVTLGFEPRESVVMVALVGGRSFQARVDLPAVGDPGELEEVVRALGAPVARHRVEQAALVLYTADAVHAARVARALGSALERRGVRLFDLLRVDGRRWWPARGRRAGVPRWGVPFDPTTHPIALEAVIDGQVPLASREELAARLEPLPEEVSAVARELTLPGGGAQRADQAEARWASAQLPRAGSPVVVPAAADLARLVVALGRAEVHDTLWSATPDSQDAAHARQRAAFWVEVVRRTPRALVAAPAAVLALAAWHAGQGALAWCAIDLARAADPDHSPSELVAGLLEDAVPPATWRSGEGRAGA